MGSQHRMEGDVGVVEVRGKLMGGKETQDVHERVKELLENGIRKIVLDLSGVKWLNSKGLGMITSCQLSAQNVDGRLKISGATEKIQSLFMITRLITVFDTYDSAAEAVAAF